jgi:Na+/H+-dicarboxylate symporter
MNARRPEIAIGIGGALFLALLLLGQPGLAYVSLFAALGLLCFATRLGPASQISIAIALGLALGSWPESHVADVHFIGVLFIKSLKMLIGPMILLSIMHSIGGMREARELGGVGSLTLALYALTMALAVATGLIFVNVFDPGVGTSLVESELFRGLTAAHTTAPAREVGEMLTGLLVQLVANPIGALAEGRILPIVTFAILMGLALLQLGDRARPLVDVLGAANQAVMLIIGWFVRLAPIGVFALIGNMVATFPIQQLVGPMLSFSAVVFSATLLHAMVTLPLIAYWLAALSPLALFAAIRDALIVAFTTSSSAATLPVTTRCVEDGLGVRPGISSFVLPLGATVNMDGTALYEAVAAIFVANLYGIELSLAQQLVIFAISMVTAVGAPGIPSAGMVTMVVVLEAVGLPTEAIALLLTLDRLLDTFRTMANVEGDAVVAACVDARS